MVDFNDIRNDQKIPIKYIGMKGTTDFRLLSLYVLIITLVIIGMRIPVYNIFCKVWNNGINLCFLLK